MKAGNIKLIREISEQNEYHMLSKHAAKAAETRGRQKKEEECPVRTCYQRDRDRIVHSRAFRRLKHKTQVFLYPVEDHYRTRLTHTLEASGLGRVIARALRQNEDLTEAIILGHDLGHTPFGHAGEEVLDRCYAKGFQHNEQSLRIVNELERNGNGLNLTYEVRDGIVKHPKDLKAETLEGTIAKWADRFAYIHHDLDDAVRAKIITLKDVPAGLRRILGGSPSAILDTAVLDMIQTSYDQPFVKLSPEIEKAFMELRKFMFDRVYNSEQVRREDRKMIFLLEALYKFYCDHPEELPDVPRTSSKAGIERSVVDFISGMTDRYAVNKFTELFQPSPWMAP